MTTEELIERDKQSVKKLLRFLIEHDINLANNSQEIIVDENLNHHYLGRGCFLNGQHKCYILNDDNELELLTNYKRVNYPNIYYIYLMLKIKHGNVNIIINEDSRDFILTMKNIDSNDYISFKFDMQSAISLLNLWSINYKVFEHLYKIYKFN